MDYKKLEGKEIKITESHHTDGIVIGCDPEIGITIMDVDKKGYICCIQTYKFEGFEKESLEIFEYVVDCIGKGILNMTKIFRVAEKLGIPHGPGPNAESCPFSQ